MSLEVKRAAAVITTYISSLLPSRVSPQNTFMYKNSIQASASTENKDLRKIPASNSPVSTTPRLLKTAIFSRVMYSSTLRTRLPAGMTTLRSRFWL